MARVFSRLSRWQKRVALALPAGGAIVYLEAYLRTAVRDAELPDRCRYPASSGVLTKAHVQRLEREGFVVLEDAEAILDGDALRAARADVGDVLRRGGRFDVTENSGTARQDLICWVRESDGTPAGDTSVQPLGRGLVHCVRLLRGLSDELESCGYSISKEHRVPKQLQLALYPGDNASEYVRHRDTDVRTWQEMGLLAWLQDSDLRERSVTIILYLNDPAWKKSLRSRKSGEGHGGGDGGELRVYHCNDDGFTDVCPRGGTVILFDSRRILHQVMPSSRARFALTVWIAGQARELSE